VNGLNTLSEEKYILVKQYNDLLDTVEAAFDYILKSFNDLSFTEGDRLLNDVFQAFSQIINTNFILAEHFKDSSDVLKNLALFSEVVEKAEMLDGKFNDQTAKQNIISEHLHPAFTAWKEMVEKELKPYSHV
jgi:hypothetical protein